MITGKIILKSGTKLTLDQRFSEIAKQPAPIPRIQQQTSVTIPKFRQELFGNKQSATMSIANRLKKRSINYRLGMGNNAATFNRQYTNPRPAPVFQRISFGDRRRGGRGGGVNSFLYGGQSGMGLRLRGQGRVGTRIFRSRTRGYLNNDTISRFSGFTRRGNNNNKNNRGRRFGNRSNRGRPNGNKNFMRGRGNGRNQNQNQNRNRNKNNNNNTNFTKEILDSDLDKYMAKANIDNNSIEMNTI
ncbi:unnamed protein product [Rotaria sp. Silwood2]|nr:unnamed protein product [Rotaria sp. Silwood2]CAF3004662.1 unnamed protein product [Rotaria sp. Silwood2]CAF4070315.1 unnamed protein product [Rotaria sp. Silwood2]CAF4305338.1 unnamed protein product [Rotaria sp. Silwood2]